MGTQRPVIIGDELPEDLGGPVAEHHGKKKLKGKSKKTKIEDKIKEKKFEKVKEISEEKPERPDEEVGETKKTEKAEKSEEIKEASKRVKVGKAKVRSKKYQELNKLIDSNRKYDFADAIDLVKKTSLSKFDGNVEVHIRLLSKTGKPENVRGLIQYPHPTGKKINIIILDEKAIAEIEKTGKAPADIYLATSEMMPKIAKLAKILGPKGKMPNPKSGTITTDPEKTKKELEGGKLEYKADAYGIIHQVIGKVSADNKALEDNLQALLAVLPADKIASITLCATMGPGVKVLI